MNRYVLVCCVLSLLMLFSALNLNSFESYLGVEAKSSETETLVYVDPQTCEVALGSTFTINISIADVVGLFSYEFKVYYDTTLLDGIQVELPEGHILEPIGGYIFIGKLEIRDDFNSTHGCVFVAVTLLRPEPGKTGSGVLATITFQVAKIGSCILDIYEPWTTLVNDMGGEITHEVRDGYFESETAEHDIAVFLGVPGHLVPMETTIINAAVQNCGQNDETDLVLQLLIDGNIVDSIEISFLPMGSSHTLNYHWAAPTEAAHNVTAYAPVLAGEDNTLNNANSKTVAVSYVIKVPVHFPTIQQAIQIASPGDTIQVSPGTYYEHLIIDRPVTLASENINDTIIDGSGYMYVVEMTTMQVDGWIGGASRISGFTIQNGLVGVSVQSHDNIIEENIVKNCEYGIYLWQSASNNVIRRNTITSNECGILCDPESWGNMIYHNNFIDNVDQAADEGENAWDHQDEGNYWSDYNGTDTDEDDIGETPYDVNATIGVWDNTPLVWAYAFLPGDLNDDGEVDASDLGVVAASFGSYPRHPRWNPAADINSDGKINVVDMVLVAKNFGK